GVPDDAASPREQMTKCVVRPDWVSRAMTPPHPNSMSSGCAPKANRGGSSGGDFGMGFIRTFNCFTIHKRDFRCFFRAKIGLFAGSGNVMRAIHHRLHPT